MPSQDVSFIWNHLSFPLYCIPILISGNLNITLSLGWSSFPHSLGKFIVIFPLCSPSILHSHINHVNLSIYSIPPLSSQLVIIEWASQGQELCHLPTYHYGRVKTFNIFLLTNWIKAHLPSPTAYNLKAMQILGIGLMLLPQGHEFQS